MRHRFSLKGVGPDALPTNALLVFGKQVLGRSSACDIAVKHLSVSRAHAEIVVTESGVTVTDLGSCNGTFVEGRRILTCRVTDRQAVRFGMVTFFLVAEYDMSGEADSQAETDKGGDRLGLAKQDAARLRLSPAQQRVFKLLVEGSGEKQISTRLNLSKHTVHNHVRAIYTSYYVHSRAELLALLLQRQREEAGPPS